MIVRLRDPVCVSGTITGGEYVQAAAPHPGGLIPINHRIRIVIPSVPVHGAYSLCLVPFTWLAPIPFGWHAFAFANYAANYAVHRHYGSFG